MAQQTIVAQFETRRAAQKAVEDLVQAGISRSSIRLLPETETSHQPTGTTSSYDHTRDEGGFWASLGDMFLPDEDRYAYAEGMSRGAVTVSITTDDAHLGRVSEIVERHGAIDLDERESSWQASGWKGYTGSAGTARTTAAASGATAARTATSQGDEVIPIVEEQIRVGKRQVNQGKVRIRSYMVETPVHEQVSLREEHVQVERRPVDRPVTGADEALFRERTIEATESREEAVVSKEARVKEELVIKKDVEERTQTVQDTVRRTEVEVEDERTTGRATTTETDRTKGPR